MPYNFENDVCLHKPNVRPYHSKTLYRDLFFQKKGFIFWSIFEVFPNFSLFFELRRLWDHSQIVDLIFPLKPVSSRASETSKTPHSWQNNVPKRPKTFLKFFC